jgi:hypothetical protein
LLAGCGLSLSQRLSVCGACPVVSVLSLGFSCSRCLLCLFLLGFVFASATGPRRSQEAAGPLEVLAVLSWRVRAAGEERGAAAGKEGQARNHRKRNQLADDSQAVGSRSFVFGRCRVRKKRQLAWAVLHRTGGR